jgi:anti-anti-sigma factor
VGHELVHERESLTVVARGIVGKSPVRVCVVTVEGELDTLSIPLLDACVAEQLADAPAHLILNFQPVRFLASKGLTSLLCARELAETTGTQLHLASLVTRGVARLSSHRAARVL